MGLSSAVMSSCSDNETELVQNKPIDGISFSVTDVQNTVDATSLKQKRCRFMKRRPAKLLATMLKDWSW